MKAGASERIITPEYPTLLLGYPEPRDRYHQSVHDDLKAHCFYFESHGEEFALVTLDLVDYTKWRTEKMRNKIKEASGIPCNHICISCTHTHSGPVTRAVPFFLKDETWEMYPYYLDMVDSLAADGIAEAKANAFMAKIGMDKGHCGKRKM